MEGLCHGHDAMPQFAGTKQKIANAIIELEDGKPARIVQVEGSYLQFDQAGKVHESLQRGAIEAMEMLPALERSERIKPSKVVDIAPKLKREKWERENRWTPAKQDLDLIAVDIFNRRRVTSHDIKAAKIVSPCCATARFLAAARTIITLALTRPPMAGGEVKRRIRSTRRHPLRCRLREGWSLLDLVEPIPTKAPKLKTRDSLASEAVDSNQRSGC
jgi:hypothetical protein